MIKKYIIVTGLLFFFLALIFYNLKTSQKEISSSVVPVYRLTLVKHPSTAVANKPVEFVWNIEAPDTATTPTTTIYYDSVSSPSALTNKDTPQAVGYSKSLPDYQNGRFALPDTFSARQVFSPGKIYYRGYAKVGEQNLWSAEFQLLIQ